ncbi:Pullulanase secretion envelope PulD [Anaerohalosphaera lusitana]|uniref:Pullulanase secretion envelope PulD n=1 Tax=Anaerohalosphaera lusitana TaxID=1936003 RepID=A0A1U9NP69_9BACT|nr:secretin N-terminal domain-containing protein [Anaerohalosphaera lusitana]AQT69635.1 Pullulanase secretion envelope PulD [Anaerohalosphaera lusitana]
MLTGWLSCYRRNRLNLMIVLVILTALPTLLSAAEDSKTKKAAIRRNISKKLINVPAKQAAEILKSLDIGQDVNDLTSNIILVTGQDAEDTRKAREVLKVIDSKRPYSFRKITSAEKAEQLPDFTAIEDEIGNIRIGTFTDPPFGETSPLAIVDTHGDSLIVIAPEDLLGTIQSKVKTALSEQQQAKEDADLPAAAEHPELVAALEKLKDKQQADKKQDQPEKAVDEQPSQKKKTDEDFMQNELFAALAEAETAAETEPNKPARQSQQVVTEQKIVEAPAEDEAQQAEKQDEAQQNQESGPMPGINTDKVMDPTLLEALKKLAEQGRPQPDQQEQEPTQLEKQQPLDTETQPADEDSKIVEDIVQEEPSPRDRSGDTLDYLQQELSEEELETTLTLPEKVELTALIELVGKQLGLNYIYDPVKIKGVVTLKLHEGKIKVRDTYALLETVLKFRGFVMTRRGDLVTIVPEAEALAQDPAFRTPDDGLRPGDVIATTIYKLDYVDTQSAAQLLQNMKLTVDIQQIPETNTLIITEYAYRINRVEKLLKMIDVPGKPKTFAYRQLKYTLAANLVTKLESLAEKLGSVTVTISPEASSPQQPAGRTPARRPTPQRRPQQRTANQGGQQPVEGIYLDVDERTNRILMIGVEEDIDAVDDLIDALDVQKQDLREIRQYEIENVGAEEVQGTLSELGIISGTAGQYGGRSRTATRRTPARPQTNQRQPQPQTTTTTGAGTGEDILSEEPQVVVLEATNSLLVNASPEQHEQVALVIAYVDAKLEKAANPYVIYSLENQKPEELATVLEKILDATSVESKGVAQEGGVQTEQQMEEEEVIIVPDEKSASLIVYANRKKQEQVAEMIEILDRLRPQVLIDVTLVEISKDETFNYDLELVSAFPDLDHTSGLLNNIGNTTTDDVLNDLNTNAWDRSNFLDLRSSGGRLDAFYADNQIQGLLTLIQEKGYGRVLAQPKILVNDNEEGVIDATNTIYVARTSSESSGGDNDFVAETTTFDEFESGINLTITPHISQGDLLRLELELDRSNQDPPSSSDENVPPGPKRANTIGTTVTVPNSSTIILGGILQLNQSKGTEKVPFLGDLPLVGGLFRGINNSDQQTKLYIFVKAHIVRPNQESTGLPDLENISKQKRDAFEDAEREFQEYQSWPGIEPEPVDPLKVLDAE